MAKLKRLHHDHGGCSKCGAAWLAILVLTLFVTGLVIHGQEEGAALEWSAWEARWHHGAIVLHGAFAWIFCVVVGRWAWPHVVVVWRHRSDMWIWGLGLAVASIRGLEGITGLGLLYGPADWREALSWLGWWVGLIWSAFLAAHACK